MGKYELPAITSLRNVSIALDCYEDFDGEMGSCCFTIPSPDRLPNLKRLSFSSESMYVYISIEDGTGNKTKIQHAATKYQYATVQTLEFIGGIVGIVGPSQFQSLFPNCKSLDANFSGLEEARITINPKYKFLRLISQSQTAQHLAFLILSISTLSVSENLVLWALHFVPNMKYLEIIGEDRYCIGYDKFKVKNHEDSKRKAMALQWLYTPGETKAETVQAILKVSPNLKGIFGNHKSYESVVMRAHPRVMLLHGLLFRGVSKLGFP
ncbi:hypothetical protein DSO57_1008019 [Entomophthora muscae]|uniref:Uncharacterized protein n=1 Tax=Entomophthora muscae TaxID=34485 RepID=A0ACC2US45_9FUNG|nr:hypothetical protein DSO57_1008019 [Entomophthora muscae]